MPHYVICDLDNTLIKSDLLHEQWAQLIVRKPYYFFISLYWMIKGLATFKYRMAELCSIQAEELPYRIEVLNELRSLKTNQNNVLILASASPEKWVKAVAQYLDLFSHILHSSESSNLKSEQKREAIQKLLPVGQPFTYIGDCSEDLAIWKVSQRVSVVNPTRKLLAEIEKLGNPVNVISTIKDRSTIQLIVKQLRLHQWIKNVLVFLPLAAAHRLFQLNDLILALYAFLGFSFSASLVYIFNDILDLESDRKHIRKRQRPFASGDLPIKIASLLVPFLILGLIVFTTLLPASFLYLILSYFVLNIVYSNYLKRIIVIDIISLSVMYTLRIFAGSFATGIFVSEWLLSFSTFFFFGLACLKRFAELILKEDNGLVVGRGYGKNDSPFVMTLGATSGLISILILLFYLQSNDVALLYHQPRILWLVMPVLLYWVSRIWILAQRKCIDEDPVIFASKDSVSWICFILLLVIFGISL